MRRDSTEHVAMDAVRLLNSPAARKARDDTKAALYDLWIAAETPEERERVWGMASGFERYWRVMQSYHTAQSIEEHSRALKEAVA